MVPQDLAAWMKLVRHRAITHDDAYRIARDIDRARPRADSVGYRMFWMRGDGACGCIDAAAERGRHIVIGRHDHCDVILDDEDEAISLRHVLVRISSLDDGFPVINLLDLQTAGGFELSDGSKQRCVVASGPLSFRVGPYTLVALPNGVKLDDELPKPVVEHADADPYTVRGEKLEVAQPSGGARKTLVTIIPESRQLEEVVHRAAAGNASPTSADRYELVLESLGRRAAIRLSTRDLEHGFLLGRSDKCIDAGIRAILSEDVSRVHALFIKEREGIFAYDAGSTNGMQAEGAKVRCVALSDEGSELGLAHRGKVRVRWRAV